MPERRADSEECTAFQPLSDNSKHPVAMRQGETPVPIPNTMVKTLPADGTMLETAWKSRWLPDLDYNIRKDFIIYIKTEAKASVCTLKTT